MLFGPAEVRVTATMSPGAASRFDMDRLQPGRAADHLAGKPALPFDEDVRLPADVARLNATWCAVIRACSRCSRSSITSGAIWSSIVAAGVPGRGLYLNE